jgi:hypothetical protein
MEHFLSAIGTEFFLHPNEDISDIIFRILDGKCAHWYPHLYSELYPIWESKGFRFHKLRALSELTPSAGELEWNTTMYGFRLPKEHITIEDSLNTLPPNQWNEIKGLIGEEEKWLKRMLKPQYIGRNWEEYSDLEDSFLEMKCKVMDLEAEVKLFEESVNRKLEIQKERLNSQFVKKLWDLKQINEKLQSKLDYTESMMGKPPKKLI